MELSKEVMERIEDYAWDYEVVGIRTQSRAFELGAISHLSHVWDDGNDTGVELDGICVVDVHSLKQACSYFGDHVAIIGGNSYEYGEDAGEIIIHDPVVIEILS